MIVRKIRVSKFGPKLAGNITLNTTIWLWHSQSCSVSAVSFVTNFRIFCHHGWHFRDPLFCWKVSKSLESWWKCQFETGKASISLHLELDQEVPPQQFKSPNARDRRRHLRADARKSQAEVTEETIEAEQAVNHEVVEKATDSQTIVNTGKVAVNDDETLYEVKFLASENCRT